MASLGLTAVTVLLVLFALRSEGIPAKAICGVSWAAYATVDLLVLGVI